MSFTRQQIIDLAKQTCPDLNTTNWSGPASVHVSRRVRQLGESEVLDLLRAPLQRDYVGEEGELEIHFSRAWTPVPVPDEPFALQLTSVPSTGVLPNLMVGFDLVCGKERIASFQAPLQARVWQEVPVAHSPVARGQLLRDADITLEKRDVLARREPFIPFPVTNQWLEAQSNIQAGSPVWNRLAHMRPAMRRGQLVEAVFQDGLLTISLKVLTLEDGALGQTVRVRNPKTNRELYGKIQNQDLVLIAL